MCGRFSLDTTKAEIAKEFKCSSVAYNRGRYNIAPSQDITVVINEGESNEAIQMRWGLIPHWVKSLDTWKSNLINARIETIEEKPSLIPVSGFYEWSKDKQPYYFHTGSLFALAGIWSAWNDPETEEQLLSCTILTTEAKGAIAEVHHRMPVIISSEYYDLWLGEVDGRKELVESLPQVNLQLYPVSKTVNSPKNDSVKCIEAIGDVETQH
jgi:putative SOS response-associated peptidase YedK